MDREAWWATVHGVAKSQTRLSDLTFTFTLVNDNNKERTYQLRIPNSQIIANCNTIHRRVKKICSAELTGSEANSTSGTSHLILGAPSTLSKTPQKLLVPAQSLRDFCLAVFLSHPTLSSDQPVLRGKLAMTMKS